jgi:DNA primase
MEIAEIKKRLSIKDLLYHYGLVSDTQHRLCCPFHDDKTPSMQVYYKTNTVYCFSGNCKTHGHSLDVIDFIMHKEGLSKHASLKKAVLLLGGVPQGGTAMGSTTTNDTLIEQFKASELSVRACKGIDYLVNRGLDWQILRDKAGLRLGYNADRAKQMKNCLLFPLRHSSGEIVSLYGRSIFDIDGKKHYYSKDRKGLFPFYPSPQTQHLVLTESIIDACTLLQYTDWAVLALYGTNGLTAEHQEAIKGLSFLEEITLFFDGDEAGRKAITTVASQLKNATNASISQVQTPDNEDVNSLIQSHEPSILSHLIENRTAFFFSTEKDIITNQNPIETAIKSQNTPSGGVPLSDTPLKIISAELLIYEIDGLKISILGGVKLTGLDKLRATLKMEQNGFTMPLRHSLDLYNALQLDALQHKMQEHFTMESKGANALIEGLISSLERHRQERMQAIQPQKVERHQLSEAEKYEALQYLKAPNLLLRTAQSIAESGIVGEETNAMIAFLIYTSRKRENPLHLVCLGASGTGKTYLQEKVGELMPSEEKMEITTLSENAFYYFGREELKHKLILIEDLDGATDVLYPLRELQSKRKIAKTVTLKDSKGNLKTVTLTVEGPVSVSGCTTREKLYEDNANRSILIETDLSQAQDSRIMDYQRKLSAGLINKAQEHTIKALLQNVQRILKPVVVRNSYAPFINLPEVVFKPRRTIGLLLSFIETITFYHQYQLPTKSDPQTGELYIETQPEHIESAFELLKEVLFRKSDELTGASRSFLEKLKKYLKQDQTNNFTAKEVRKVLKLNPSNLKRYLIELERYGYLKGKGNRYKGYEYSITDMSEYENLTKSIQADLQAIIQKVKQSAVQK